MPVTHNHIQTTTLSSAATSVTFSSIPQTYTHLEFKFYITGVSATGSSLQFPINGGGQTYNAIWVAGYYPGSGSTTTYISTENAASPAIGGVNTGWNGAGSGQIMAFNYTDTGTYRLLGSVTGNFDGAVEMASITLNSKNALTSATIQLNGTKTFSAGSVFSVHGIKEA